MVRQFTA